MRGQLSCSISSSKVATVARAFWWASLTSVRILSAEASLFSFLGVLLLGGQKSVGLGSLITCGVLPPFHPWQSSKEDKPQLQVLALWQETPVASRVCIPHSIRMWTPPCWSGALPAALGPSFVRPCQQPWWIIHSASFCPCSEACWNILCRRMRQWGLSASHLASPSRNSSTSIRHSASHTDRPSLAACPLAARDLSLLLPYLNVNSLWYLKKMRKHSSN